MKLFNQSENKNIEKSEDLKVINLELKDPLSLVVFKSRVIGYEIEEHEFPFMLIFYFMHGPVDKDDYSC